MSTCYSVSFKAKVKDRAAATAKIKDFTATENAHLHLDEFHDEGVDTDSFEGLVQVCLAGWRCTQYRTREEDGFTVFENDFNASYGWEVVLIDMFKALAPFLEDGSSIYIEPDDDYDEFIIENGEIVRMH